ncbi:MAG: hypothetical protein LBN00_05790 [Oscillospiraceae bacterium]|jgi:membrane-associated phospholipid phosphatase|nr:hypothetical protein [Oscillospiraceae bacterium]
MKKFFTTEFYRRNPHVVRALFLPAVLIAFFALERLVIHETYFVTYTPLDDVIPFLPVFVIPYCLWHPALFALGVHHMVRDAAAFRRYIGALSLGLFSTMLFCALFPNGQNLRPVLEPPYNFFTWLINGIYRVDTNTNVLPSMHIIGLMVIMFGLFDSKYTRKKRFIIPSAVVCALIAASTVLIKQHSILDVYAGFAVGAVICVIVYVFIRKAQNGEPAKINLNRSRRGNHRVAARFKHRPYDSPR